MMVLFAFCFTKKVLLRILQVQHEASFCEFTRKTIVAIDAITSIAINVLRLLRINPSK